jgi:hypothetical protein
MSDHTQSEGFPPLGNLDPNKQVDPKQDLRRILKMIKWSYFGPYAFSPGEAKGFKFDTLCDDENLPEVLNHLRFYHLHLLAIGPVKSNRGHDLHRIIFRSSTQGRQAWLN